MARLNYTAWHIDLWGKIVSPKYIPISIWQWWIHTEALRHVSVNQIIIIGSCYVMVWCLVITGTNDDWLSVRPLSTEFNKIWIKILQTFPFKMENEILSAIHTSSFKKMHLKISSAKWRPFFLGLNVLIGRLVYQSWFSALYNGASSIWCQANSWTNVNWIVGNNVVKLESKYNNFHSRKFMWNVVCKISTISSGLLVLTCWLLVMPWYQGSCQHWLR